MRIRDVASVVADARLTPDAVRVVLHYAFKPGAGPHPYDADELRELLEEGGPKRIAAALRRAERHGYLVRKIGGRGHSDAFTALLSPAETDDLNRHSPAVSEGLNADSPAETDGLNTDRSAETEGLNAPAPTEPGVLPLRPAKTDDLSDRPADMDDLNASGERGRGDYRGVGESSGIPTLPERQKDRERDNTPSIVSPTALDEKAAEAIDKHSALLAGCRGALRDYLIARVEPARQYAYVQRLATAMNGLGVRWNPLGLDQGIPEAERPGLVAAALNELLATGERNAEQPMKWPDGDPRNLFTKLEILAKQQQRDGRNVQHSRESNYRGRPDRQDRGASQGPGGRDPAEDYAHLG